MNLEWCIATSSARTVTSRRSSVRSAPRRCTRRWAASGLLKPYMRPIYAGAQACGTAVTVLLQPGDNWMLHVAAEQIQPGDIVVAGGHDRIAPTAISATCWRRAFKARGARGLIIDGGVRDVSVLTEMKFPVWSKAISAKGTVKATLGSVNIPVVCAGALVKSGRCRRGGRRRRGRGARGLGAGRCSRRRPRAKPIEGEKRAKLASGVLGLDMYNMREPLQQAGLRYID